MSTKEDKLVQLLKDYNGYDFCGEKACSGQNKANELIKEIDKLFKERFLELIDKTGRKSEDDIYSRHEYKARADLRRDLTKAFEDRYSDE